MAESVRSTSLSPTIEPWPALPLEAWQDTYATLHMWTQIVGKIRKALTPLVNHWWNVTLYVTPRGLTTSTIPWESRVFDIEFDFLEHQLVIRTSDRRNPNGKAEAAFGRGFLPGTHGESSSPSA